MAVSTFKYCEVTDVEQVYSKLAQFDTKRPIYNWVTTDTSNQYQAFNTGVINQLYFDGIEGTSVTDDPNATYEYNYSSTTDSVQVFHASKNPNDMTIESGLDYNTFITDQIERASQQLNSMLDHSRFPIPIPKAFQYSSDPANDTPEYDYIIVRLTALLTAYNCIVAHEPESEEANAIYEQITNVDDTGLLDKLNAGNISLNFETNTRDIKGGNPIEVVRTGTMHLVESYCEGWTGARFDRVQIVCTTGGAYGTALVSIKTSDGEKLFGNEVTGQEVTGGLDSIGNGLFVRFEGASMAVNDRWDIEVRNVHVETTNKNVKSINAHRGSKYANARYWALKNRR